MLRRVPSALVAAVASVGLVASWPFAQVAWQDHRAEDTRRELLQQLEQEDPVGSPASSRATASRATAAPGGTRAVAHPVVAGASEGEPFAALRIERFGEDWVWPVLEGTSEEVIDRGLGHYTGTPLPGDRGNVAIAGHRAGHGSPFLDFDALRPGDRVEVAQGATTWVYTLTTAPEIISADDDWVLDATPGRGLTLTTCWPRYGSSKRMFVRAELSDVRRQAA